MFSTSALNSMTMNSASASLSALVTSPSRKHTSVPLPKVPGGLQVKVPVPTWMALAGRAKASGVAAAEAAFPFTFGTPASVLEPMPPPLETKAMRAVPSLRNSSPVGRLSNTRMSTMRPSGICTARR